MDLCLRDRADEGLSWLVRALEQSEPLAGHDDSPEPLLREEIAPWSLETHPLERDPCFGRPGGAVAFSADGRTALTGSYDWTARLWDVATGCSGARH